MCMSDTNVYMFIMYIHINKFIDMPLFIVATS